MNNNIEIVNQVETKLNSLFNITVQNKDVINKIDTILKKTENDLNERLLHFEKTVTFNDNAPYYDEDHPDFNKSNLVPSDWWETRYYGKTWKTERVFDSLSFRKTNGKYKLMFSRSAQSISLGVEELEGVQWYHCIDNQEYLIEPTPVTVASIEIKVNCFKEITRLVEKITSEIQGLPF